MSSYQGIDSARVSTCEHPLPVRIRPVIENSRIATDPARRRTLRIRTWRMELRLRWQHVLITEKTTERILGRRRRQEVPRDDGRREHVPPSGAPALGRLEQAGPG